MFTFQNKRINEFHRVKSTTIFTSFFSLGMCVCVYETEKKRETEKHKLNHYHATQTIKFTRLGIIIGLLVIQIFYVFNIRTISFKLLDKKKYLAKLNT